MQVSLMLLEKLNPENIFEQFLTLDFCFLVEIETFQDEKYSSKLITGFAFACTVQMRI